MKKILLFLFIQFSITVGGYTQNQTEKFDTLKNRTNTVYEIYPTTNMWNFIKLNTRNGKMKIVQYTIKNDNGRFEYSLNETELVSIDKEVNGRFKLQPTQNSYNFILLDQIDGRIWQVQWSFEANNRFVIPIE
ncbi:MAG: hypothetical protein H6Q16_684 [Bacteroidetes bacterium]|nr:hypothetical protein [Bacteroidota bacterium]